MTTASQTIDKKGGGRIAGIKDFIRETRAEWDKSTFPSREDVLNTTVIVAISVIFFAIFLFIVDKSWVFLLQQLSNLINAILGA